MVVSTQACDIWKQGVGEKKTLKGNHTEGSGVIVIAKFKLDSLGQEPNSWALCWTNLITSLTLFAHQIGAVSVL